MLTALLLAPLGHLPAVKTLCLSSQHSQSLHIIVMTVLRYGDEPWSFLDKHLNRLSGFVKCCGRPKTVWNTVVLHHHHHH